MAGGSGRYGGVIYEPSVDPSELDRCLPWLEAALEYQGFGMTVEEMCEAVGDGFDFWPGERAAIITEHTGDTVNFWLAGGDLDELERMVPAVEHHAHATGAQRITLYGRRGWERTFLKGRGYDPRWTIMVKDL